ncbi:hypothetical protein ONS95_004567 [Cadophora gregata]|uniref:uncharacterized protein n=1 Tax=Cadophora gregata TaxID=51156 RepID=UPI0026DBDE48|nr:uncharacterized protein ONS95_004567 [Cadophora gregata]KAK0105069.1 hypothetical protein ONS96_004472 [Cadophora gregata f. sp. sojae]KAK0106062.1 hypothetical protein ONS95_004567 [Cadophora gregata]
MNKLTVQSLDPTRLADFVHKSPAITIPLVGASTAVVIWCIKDYGAFLALGRGGVPYNIFGWAVITILVRPFALGVKEVTWTGDYPSEGAHQQILDLPPRSGGRAKVAGIAPHRQMTQNAPESMKAPLKEAFDNIVKKHPKLLETKRSLYEKHHDAIFVQSGFLQDPDSPIPQTARVSRGEIGHIHHDASVHLYFSPADAKLLIEKNWAERHRLARMKPFLGRVNMFSVAGTYLMIYGPRDEGELETMRIILENSVKFMTGVEDL